MSSSPGRSGPYRSWPSRRTSPSPWPTWSARTKNLIQSPALSLIGWTVC